MRLALDLIDEVRDETNAKIIEYQKWTSSYYNLSVKGRSCKEGGLALKKIEVSGVGHKGKLPLNWEGPYKVQSLRGPRAYKLESFVGEAYWIDSDSDNDQGYGDLENMANTRDESPSTSHVHILTSITFV